MLKRLRSKFIISNTLHVSIVLVVVFILICFITHTTRRDALESTLLAAIQRSRTEEDAAPVQLDGAEDVPDTDFIPYVICILPEHDVKDMQTIRFAAEISDEALYQAVELALASEDESGDAQRHLFFVKKVFENETRIALTNDSHIMHATTVLAKRLILIIVCAVALVIAVSFPVAKGALLSTENAWEQQKRFIADASHALKTPLTVILANIGILKNSRFAGEDENRHWLKSTEDEAHEMHALIQDMLLLVQSDLNVRREEFQQINLSQLITGLALQFEALAFDRSILMETSIPEGVEIRGNEKSLMQMASALIENALKYEKEGGLIRIGLEKQVRRTILTVYNASTWIRPEEKERIFDRFCRLKNGASAPEGHGLGLSIARSVADAHEAVIDIESTEHGGTEFRVTFKNKFYKEL